METGPVDVYIIGFPGNKFTGRIAPAIRELVDRVSQVMDVGAHAVGMGVQPGHDRRSRRTAHRADRVCGVKAYALLCQPVYVGRAARRIAVAAHGRELVLVGEDEQDVWLCGIRHSTRPRHQHKWHSYTAQQPKCQRGGLLWQEARIGGSRPSRCTRRPAGIPGEHTALTLRKGRCIISAKHLWKPVIGARLKAKHGRTE